MPSAAPQPAFMFEPTGAARRAECSRGAFLLATGLVMAAALAVVTPFFFLGNASGHDFDFHVASWMDVAEQWRLGVLYPRWAIWANYGYGEPRFIFYPPLSWILGAGLGCVLPWRAVPGAFIWVALVLAGVSMFHLAREWLPAADATRAALFYAVNPYHLLVVYFRSDYAELLASAVLPLLVLYALGLGRNAQAGRRAVWREIVPLALVFAAVWLSNAPAAVVVTYCLALLLAVLAVLRRSAVPLLGGGLAMLVGLLLAGVYIVPAAFEQDWVNIAEALSSGLRPEQNFLFTFINDQEHNLFNLLVSTIATAEIAVTAAAALALGKPAHAASRVGRELWWGLVALGAVSVTLMLSVSSPAWRYLPKLRYVQFPWRWLVPLGLAFAIFVAAAIGRTRARHVWTLLVAVTLAAVALYLVHEAWWDTESVLVIRAALQQGKGFEGTDEYSPRGADRYDLPKDAPLVANLPTSKEESSKERAELARVRVERWSPETKLVAVGAEQPVTLALRLVNYPAWRAEINGQPARADSQQNTGQMLIRVPAGRSRVRVRFARTADRTAGFMLSCGAGLLLVGLALAGHGTHAAPFASPQPSGGTPPQG